ncbi:hypothetical protein D3C77_240910 [compost metagenome]
MGEVAQVPLDPGLHLLGLVGGKLLAVVGSTEVGDHAALGQAFDIVGIQRNRGVPGFDHQAQGRSQGAFVIGRIAQFLAHPLGAHAESQQHFIVGKTQGVGHREAGQRVVAGLVAGADIAGDDRLAGVIDVGHVLAAGDGGGPTDVLVQQRGAQYQLMIYRAGDEVAANPGLGGQAVGVAGLIVGFAAGVAVAVGDDHPGAVEKTFVAGAGAADAGECAPVVVQVVLATQDHCLADLLGRDAFENVGVRLGRLGHCPQAGEASHHRAAVVDFFVAFVGIEFKLPAIATVIHPQRGQGAILGLFIDPGITTAVDAIEADAKTLLIAQTAAQVDMFGDIAI